MNNKNNNKKKGDKMTNYEKGIQMYNQTKKAFETNNTVKKLRIKILNKMKNTKVKPPKHFFPHINMLEYNRIPAVNGFHVIWNHNKISYNFASITIEGVINQVLKLEGVK